MARIKDILTSRAHERGWSDDTQLELLCRFIELFCRFIEHNNMGGILAIIESDFEGFLDAISDEEDALSDEEDALSDEES